VAPVETVKVSLQEVVVISLVVGVPPGTAGGVIRVIVGDEVFDCTRFAFATPIIDEFGISVVDAVNAAIGRIV